MRGLLNLLCRTTQVVLFACMLGMIVIMVSLVFTRYVFSWSPSWSEEVTRYLMIWMVMLGASTLALFDDHITLYALVEKLGPHARLIQAILVRLIVGTVCALTAWTGFKFAHSMWVVIAPGTQWPMTIPTVSIPIAMTLISLFSVLLVVHDILKLSGRTPNVLPAQSDYMDGSFRPIDAQDSD